MSINIQIVGYRSKGSCHIDFWSKSEDTLLCLGGGAGGGAGTVMEGFRCGNDMVAFTKAHASEHSITHAPKE